MDAISTIKDIDIFESISIEPKFYKVRPTVKAIVFDDEGNIALLSARGHGLFPGGGVKKRETLEEALTRECQEEIGCKVMVVTYLGQFDQHRAKTAKKYEIHFFVACILGGKGVPTTQSKGEQECILAWETKETIENMLEGQLENIPEKEYAAQFNCRTHLAAFQKFLQMEAK